jgi:hypothetical protein
MIFDFHCESDSRTKAVDVVILLIYVTKPRKCRWRIWAIYWACGLLYPKLFPHSFPYYWPPDIENFPLSYPVFADRTYPQTGSTYLAIRCPVIPLGLQLLEVNVLGRLDPYWVYLLWPIRRLPLLPWWIDSQSQNLQNSLLFYGWFPAFVLRSVLDSSQRNLY